MSMTIRRQAFCLDFPQELSDHVFETLRNDSSSLKHCSLVCRAWLHATRTHLFRQVILTPRNIDPFISLTIDSRSTVHSHVRSLELRRIICSHRWIISNFTSTLTHLHLRDMIFNAFVDILDIICSFLYLQFVALDELTVNTSCVESTQNKLLPSSVNGVRCRGGCIRSFLLWLLHHNDVPKLSNLDIGPIKEESTFEVGRYLLSVGPAMKHLSLSFDFGHNTHICALQDFGTRALLTAGYAKTNISSVAERYKALFGLDTCPNVGTLTGLQSLRLDNFVHFEDHIQATALVWAPRIIASTRAAGLREVILGISLHRAGELDKFNIHWEFLDQAFTSMDGPFAIKFEINGIVNIDGIASLIRSRLPCCDQRGLLQFCRDSERNIH
jgi:hypothetical protein